MDFGKTPDGTAVERYTLTNGRVTAKVLTYGGIVSELHVPDRDGKPGDVVLGFDTLDGYLKGHPYFGATVGRFANRIAGGKFSLDGKDYTLAVNNGPNTLHGGLKGFDKAVWKVEKSTDSSLTLSYLSKDGEDDAAAQTGLARAQGRRAAMQRRQAVRPTPGTDHRA